MTAPSFEERELLTALRLACDWFDTTDPTPEQMAAVRHSFAFAATRLGEELRLCVIANLPGGRRLLDAAKGRR